MFDSQRDQLATSLAMEDVQHLREQQIERILSRLDEREQRIIISRLA